MSEHKTIASIHHGDCLDVLRGMGDNSVDAVVTDPPYNIGKAAWDKIPDYDKWLSVRIAEASRVLKRHGAFWCFHSEPLQLAKIAKMIADTGRPLVNWITWDKYNAATPRWKDFLDGYTVPGALRCWQQFSEYIIYCADDGAWKKQTDEIRGFLYEPLRAYLDEERKRAGIGKDECNEACGFSAGGMAMHYFSRSQWCLPTREHYTTLQKLFNRSGGGYLRREYEELRREYEELRREYEELRREYEELRPTFNGSAHQSSVWQFDPAPRNGHITPKPVDLMRRIIEATTTPGQVVLDPFMGSGSTGVACAELGRHFIGIEKVPEYVEIAKARIGGAA